jgi:predicted SAM-dependent methyltransferase
MTETKRIKLNLGCGNDWMHGPVVNVDCRNLLPPDDSISFLRADLTDLAHYLEPECADEIWAKDVLEHFPQTETERLLDAWLALLAPGGTFYLKTPELGALAKYLLREDIDSTTKGFRVYGGQDYIENFHRAGFTLKHLQEMLAARGMLVVEARVVEDTNAYIRAIKVNGGSNGARNAG